jgi:hypothetical protein
MHKLAQCFRHCGGGCSTYYSLHIVQWSAWERRREDTSPHGAAVVRCSIGAAPRGRSGAGGASHKRCAVCSFQPLNGVPLAFHVCGDGCRHTGTGMLGAGDDGWQREAALIGCASTAARGIVAAAAACICWLQDVPHIGRGRFHTRAADE